MNREPIRVLVVDDSAFSRQAITRMLSASPLVEVAGIARDGEEALRKVFELEPDLVTVDLEMPRMDGFTFLRLVMSRRPTPVIVVSGRAGEDEVFKALELGAVDFVAKPQPTSRAPPEPGDSIERQLIRKVHCGPESCASRPRGGSASHSQPAHRARGARTTGGSAPKASWPSAPPPVGPAALMHIFGAFAEPPPCAFVDRAAHAGRLHGVASPTRLDRLTPMRAREGHRR